jgi:hypothetical protein
MNFHAGARYQRGRGLGSIFGGLLRGFMPILSRGMSVGKKLLTSDLAKNIGNTLMDTGARAAKNVTADLLEGRDFRNTAQEELNEAKKKIASTLRGSGKGTKRKKSCQKSICAAKKRQRKNTPYNLLNDD